MLDLHNELIVDKSSIVNVDINYKIINARLPY